ncbi:MAG: DUF3135 domain-containing protein [Thiohalomonadales bacterium]
MSSLEKEELKFDFDSWVKLLEKDPVAFESQRLAHINDFIDGCDQERQHRLRCLQWKIDTVRDKCDSPLSACVAISDMMWDSLERLHRVYYEYEGITAQDANKRVFAPLPKATVININN